MPSQLPKTVFPALENRRIGSAAIVATVDRDGSPHTAPFGSLCVVSPTTLRFGCDRKHDTYANIRRDGRATVSLVAPPDVAISIKGKAKVLKERMNLVDTDAIIEIEVEDVKDDLIPGAFIVSGILYSTAHHVKEFIGLYVDEVKAA
jgi:flavin reductase (DIM6/NTAB) family NADH-FMN oxidoreductase RutF